MCSRGSFRGIKLSATRELYKTSSLFFFSDKRATEINRRPDSGPYRSASDCFLSIGLWAKFGLRKIIHSKFEARSISLNDDERIFATWNDERLPENNAMPFSICCTDRRDSFLFPIATDYFYDFSTAVFQTQNSIANASMTLHSITQFPPKISLSRRERFTRGKNPAEPWFFSLSGRN